MNVTYIVCAGALLLAGSTVAQDGGKIIPKTTISLGTATPGGGFPLYGNAFAEVMNDADKTLAIEPRNTKGSNENIPLLEAGELDLALVAGEPSYEAFMGIGRPRTKLKILTALPTDRRWCLTDGWQLSGAPASAGPDLRPWRRARAARGSSHRMPARLRGSGRNTHFSSR